MSTVTIAATVETDNRPPRVRLNVTDIGTPNLFSVTITRLNPDGRVVPVRTYDGNPLTLTTSGANRVGLIYDYEMPYGAAVSYSAVENPSASSGEVTVNESRVWLIHPGVPTLSMPITVASIGATTKRVNRGVFSVMGRESPVVVTDGARRLPAGALQLRTDTLDELAKVKALTSDAATLLLNVPPSLGWGLPTSYISVDDISEDRLVEFAGEPKRYLTLPYQEVDRPAGGSQAERTYVDLLDYPTYNDLRSAYPTYLDLLAGP